jgi:dihydrofolate synthase/folylpolyglutamate synthase
VTYEEAKTYLYSLERRGVRLGLDRILGAFHEVGDPQEAFESVLIAGTNGKGSTAALAASTLQAAGRRTGLFTSPHLIDFRERMRIDGRMIPRDAVADLTSASRMTIERWQLSFFEATTLLAFVWFRDSAVDAAAIEVGLGGRLDATRPVRSLVDVVTSISLDHEKILGATLGAIAAEKAGIFRPGVPAAIGVSPAEPALVLRSCARAVGAPLFERRRMIRVSGIQAAGGRSRFRVAPRLPGPSLLEEPLTLDIPLEGDHQVANAALALLALALLPSRIGITREALREGFHRARWPGRAEVLLEAPRIIFDVGHNPDGARSLARVLEERGEGRVRFVIGMVEGKDHAGFLREIASYAVEIHVCTPETDRASPGEAIAQSAAALGIPAIVHPRPADAVDAALARSGDGITTVVTGSFYTVGSAISHLGISLPDPLWEARPVRAP